MNPLGAFNRRMIAERRYIKSQNPTPPTLDLDQVHPVEDSSHQQTTVLTDL